MSFFAVGVILGIILENNAVFAGAMIASIAAIIILTVFLLLQRRGKVMSSDLCRAGAVAAAFFVIGIFRVCFSDMRQAGLDKFKSAEDNITAEITDMGKYSGSYSINAKISESSLGVPKGTVIRLYCYDDEISPKTGGILKCKVKYKSEISDKLRSNGVSLRASASDISFFEGNSIFYSIRNKIDSECDSLFSHFEYADDISKAVTTGNTSGLGTYFYSLYNNAGISHILAISGLHISLITMGIYQLLMMLSVGIKTRSVIASAFAIIYSAILGFSPGTFRAAIMLSTALLLKLFMKRSDSMTSMFLSLFVLVMINPYALISSGLLLSYLSCFALLLVSQKLFELKLYIKDKTVGKTIQRVAVTAASVILIPIISSFAAVVFTFPVLFFNFDTVSYISPLTNIFAIPLFSLALMLTFASILLNLIIPSAGLIFSYPAGYIFDGLTNICKVIRNTNIGSVSVHIPFMFIPLVFSALLIISLVFLKKKRLAFSVIFSCLFVISFAICAVVNNIRLSNLAYVEVGTGMSEYIYFSDSRENIYVDLGGSVADKSAVFSNGENSLKNYALTSLDKKSLRRLDKVTASLNVSVLYVPCPENKVQQIVFDEIKTFAKQRNCDIITYVKDFSFDVQNEKFRFNRRDYYKSVCTYAEISAFGKRIDILGRNFDMPTKADTVILLPEYRGDISKIDCKKFYINDNFDLNDIKDSVSCFAYSDKVKLEYAKNKE